MSLQDVPTNIYMEDERKSRWDLGLPFSNHEKNLPQDLGPDPMTETLVSVRLLPRSREKSDVDFGGRDR